MNRREPLIMVDSPELVASGLWPDRHSFQTPLWEVAQNVQFAGGKVKRRVPNALAFAPAADPIRGIGQMQASDGVRWVWTASGPAIYRWYGPAPTLMSVLPEFTLNATSIAEPTFFDFTSWGDWLVVNSADNGAYVYKPGPPTPSFLPLDNAPQDAVQMLKKRNQLLAIGTGNNRRTVEFSDADNIEEWISTDENLAGSLPLEELSTPVRAACHFGPAVAVFGENQMFQVSWIGAPYYYGQQKLLDGIGATGKMAVCSDARLVYGVSRNGVWKTDGLQYTYIDEVVLRDYLQDNVNWGQAGKIACRKNDITGCIEFSFPMGESLVNNEGWAYDPRYGGWSLVPPFSVLDNRAILNAPLAGTDTGRVELSGADPTIAGDLLLETKGMLIQRENQALHIDALVDEIELFVHAAANVEFQYGVAEFPDGPWSWSTPMEVVTNQITYRPLTRISGTYHKLRFTNYNVNWSLDLQGFALFGAVDGQKRDKA